MIHVSLKVTGAEGMKKAKLNKITRTALRSVGNRWHDKYLARHFTRRGAQIYGYGARSGETGSGKKEPHSYVAWKKEKKGHNKPLVKSGKGMREALANKKIKARIGKFDSSVTISLPKIFNFNLRRTGKSKTNANEEIRRVTKAELRDLEKHFVKVLDAAYTKAGRRVSIAFTGFRG